MGNMDDSTMDDSSMDKRWWWAIGAVVVLALVIWAVVANGSEDEPTDEVSATPTPTASASATESMAPTEPAATTEPAVATEPAEPTESAAPTEAAGPECAVDTLDLFAPGTLTVATGEPVFEPWMVDDDPTNGEGFEGALVAALAQEMGFDADQVTFVRTGFAEVIAPGAKDWDFNIQQFSISDERDEVVDFSDGYYAVEQAVVAAEDSPAADATSVADLADVQLGAGIGTTSLDYAEQVIQPTRPVLVFDDNVAAKAAFDAGQVDALVFDLPTAYFVTAVEIPEASIVGVLPVAEEADELGMLFEEGNQLVDCVNVALAALVDDGTLDDLEEEWLNQGGDIPTLTP